jgi:2-phospho-L-lactate guanylyltransferase
VTWNVIVPVKGRRGAKSRLGDLPGRELLAEAFALDTVAALVAASAVERVFVVTSDADAASRFASLGAETVREDPALPDPLNAAVRQGLDAARRADPHAHLAVFTGDLPALTPGDVDRALQLASLHQRSMIPDEEGTGTTALLALAGVPVTPRFGSGSRAAHEADGHVPLPLPAGARSRRDVDTRDDLADAVRLGVGRHTRGVLAEAGQRSSA